MQLGTAAMLVRMEHHIGYQLFLPKGILAGDHHAFQHAQMLSQHRSISPSSMRKPRIFTCWSMRPRNSSVPSGRYRTRSPPDRVGRPGRRLKESGKQFSAVSSGRWQIPSRHRHHQCTIPRRLRWHGCNWPSNTYTWVFRIMTNRWFPSDPPRNASLWTRCSFQLGHRD